MICQMVQRQYYLKAESKETILPKDKQKHSAKTKEKADLVPDRPGP